MVRDKQKLTFALYIFTHGISIRGWITKEDIYPFGNKDLDIEMLMYAKKTRKPHRIREVKTGYRYACSLIHIDPLPQLKEVFPKSYL